MRTYIHLAHQGWGDKISISVPNMCGGNYIAFNDTPASIKGSGCMTPLPSKTDNIVVLSDEGLVTYEITKVKPMGDPRDGFHYEAERIGIVGNVTELDNLKYLHFNPIFKECHSIVKDVEFICMADFIHS